MKVNTSREFIILGTTISTHSKNEEEKSLQFLLLRIIKLEK
jgi:hypothetical protein